MNSTKLAKWIDANRPQLVPFTPEQVGELAAVAGLEVRSGHFGQEVVAWGDRFPNGRPSYYALQKISAVGWREELGVATITYHPGLCYVGSSAVGNVESPAEALVAASGIQPIAVVLPEPIIHVSIPDWVNVVGVEYGQDAWVEGLTCFRSEVPWDSISTFRRMLDELLELESAD